MRKFNVENLRSRSGRCFFFVGYLKMTTGYYFYNPNEQKVLISRNTFFSWRRISYKLKVELQEETVEATPQISVNNERQLTLIEPVYTQESRRSKKIIRPPEKLLLWNKMFYMESELSDNDL